MFAAGKVRNYDLDLYVLADKQGARKFSTLPGTANANVFASELSTEKTTDGYKLHFTLNDNIQSGQVTILEGENVIHTVELGALSKGLNSVDVATTDLSGGTYNWTVSVNASVVDRPFKYSDNSKPQLQFYSPRGVAVDNSFESPYFGRVYASEQAGGPVTGRTTKDGIYILNSALEDVTAQGANSYAGNVAWNTSANTNSPMRLTVAPDGKVYVADQSSANSGVWIMDPASPASNFTPVFSQNMNRTDGLVSNNGINVHGAIAHCYVLGVGADAKLYTFDSKYVDAVATSTGNLLQYNIGALETPWNAAPTAVVYDDAKNGNLQLNFNSSIAPDNRGGWWISQFRDTDAAGVPSLIHVNTSGIVDFNSGKTPALIGNSYQGGMAATEDGNRIAMGSRDEVKIYDVTYDESGVPTLKQVYSIKPAMGTNTAGLAFDKAGNVYVISNSSERLGVWALPKAENTFTTPAPSIQTIVVEGTGVNQVEDVNKISVYPNPVRDFVTIKSEGADLKSAAIFDMNGRQVMQERMDGSQTELNLSDLNSGTYILRIETRAGIESVRIIKK